jgi:hypothetical protein
MAQQDVTKLNKRAFIVNVSLNFPVLREEKANKKPPQGLGK